MAPLDFVAAQLSDHDLLAEVVRVAACERQATAGLVALLAEMDARRLHLAEGCSSLFTYCTERLHLSEHAAYHRIEAARATRDFPVLLEHLRTGSLTLTTVTLLRPHLTTENHERLLAAACGRSKREVEMVVRGLAPLPEVRASVRRLAAPRNAGVTVDSTSDAAASREDARAAASSLAPARLASEGPRRTADLPLSVPTATSVAVERATAGMPAAPRPAAIRILTPERYSLRVTLSAEGHARLCRAQDLLRHAVPDGDPAVVVERALALLVDHLERVKFALRHDSERPARRRRPPHTATTPAPLDAELGTGAGREPDNDDDSSSPQVLRLPPEASPRRTGPCARRRIPAAVRREVWARDEGRCAFRGASGRCRETGRLEFHHRVPVADGGGASVNNLELLCTNHHAHQSRCWFGEDDGQEPPGPTLTASDG